PDHHPGEAALDDGFGGRRRPAPLGHGLERGGEGAAASAAAGLVDGERVRKRHGAAGDTAAEDQLQLFIDDDGGGGRTAGTGADRSPGEPRGGIEPAAVEPGRFAHSSSSGRGCPASAASVCRKALKSSAAEKFL